MKRNRGPLLLALTVLALCSFLFVKGFKSPSKTMDLKSAASVAGKLVSEEQMELTTLGSLPAGLKEKVYRLQKQSSVEALRDLATLYDSLRAWPVAGSYYMKLAERQSLEENWMKAGNAYLQGARSAQDSLNVAYCVEKATMAFEKAVELNPSGLEARNALALCLAQNGTDVMKAVKLLKDVLVTDSNNLQAIFTLGMLSIQSGQYEKAAVRFERLREIEPLNPDNYFYLADIYNQLGEKDKAIRTLEVCKSVTRDDKIRKTIDELIGEIKK
jgi:tetratricopeptide (TPR) repeat protein